MVGGSGSKAKAKIGGIGSKTRVEILRIVAHIALLWFEMGTKPWDVMSAESGFT